MATIPFIHVLVVRTADPGDRQLEAHAEMLRRLLPGASFRDVRPAPGLRSIVRATIDEAVGTGADLILIAGEEAASESRLVAGQLVHRAPCSVWMTSGIPASVPESGDGPAESDGPTGIIVPVDLSERSTEALAIAARLLMLRGGGRCLALHVRVAGPQRLSFDDADTAGRARADDALARFLARVEVGGVDIESLIVDHPTVAGAIHRVTETQRHDLVVMASRGRAHAAAALLLPSDTRRVMLTSPVSVLALKRPGPNLGLLGAWRDPRVRARSEWRFN